MSIPHDPDRQFHENLSVLGSRIPVPDGPSDELRSRCVSEFRGGSTSPRFQGLRLFKRPALASALGLAACLVLVVGLLFPANGGPRVQAAEVLAKLNQQIAEPRAIRVTLDSLAIDEVFVNGQLHVGEMGVAGDVRVVVTEDPDAPPLTVDVALAISPGGGWVLIRELSIPDEDVEPFLKVFFPPGSETLLLLPDEAAVDELGIDVGDDLRELGSLRVVEAFQELIRTQPDTGATITQQADGTILLTLPITDARALADLERLLTIGAGEDAEIELHADDAEVGDEDDDLIGSTMTIVYDPAAQRVRSFAITDFGAADGTISVELYDGEIDPSMFDSSRVVTPNTRTFDLGKLESLIEAFRYDKDTEE